MRYLAPGGNGEFIYAVLTSNEPRYHLFSVTLDKSVLIDSDDGVADEYPRLWAAAPCATCWITNLHRTSVLPSTNFSPKTHLDPIIGRLWILQNFWASVLEITFQKLTRLRGSNSTFLPAFVFSISIVLPFHLPRKHEMAARAKPEILQAGTAQKKSFLAYFGKIHRIQRHGFRAFWKR